ncbi:conserved hypothetical protein [Gloeothece citriformis PCC 7424]|uniref:Aspartyl protease n=1 Tax=Gloeothece citriformis (strain PCC 7424) TaxID=65393 RepID=B7KLF9_GLOC7|nr:hypothetical protein [Gloeothece citriformis]ACK72531.1 conserved hypothetical protein [Gloeothece citriformis PCC 7424]
MIEGQFSSQGELFFEIELITEDGINLPIDVMLDTGFTEFLAINIQDVKNLGWSLIRTDELRTAQGETLFDVYLGKIIIDRQEFQIPVHAGNQIQEILLGSQWLKIFNLIAKYKEGVLRLE